MGAALIWITGFLLGWALAALTAFTYLPTWMAWIATFTLALVNGVFIAGVFLGIAGAFLRSINGSHTDANTKTEDD